MGVMNSGCAYQAALIDGAPGFASLADKCLRASEQDDVCRLEALAAAGLFARLAAARHLEAVPGCGNGFNYLAEVMLLRAAYDREQGAPAHFSGAMALRALTMAADLGQEAADTRLAAVTDGLEPGAHLLAQEWRTPDGAQEQGVFDALALGVSHGDATAINEVIDAVLRDTSSGDILLLEGLVIAEQCARLGAVAGNAGLVARLAYLLMLRAAYDRNNEAPAVVLSKQIEGLHTASVAVEMGDPGAPDLLRAIILTLPPSAVHDAARDHAVVLSFVDNAGAC